MADSNASSSRIAAGSQPQAQLGGSSADGVIVTPAGRIFVFRGSELLVRADDLALPGDEVRGHDWAVDIEWQAVGEHLGQACISAALARETAAPAGYIFKRLREMFAVMGEEASAVACRAFQIAEW